MFTEVVTLVTLAIFWGRFEAGFLTTRARISFRKNEGVTTGYYPILVDTG